MVGLLSQDIQLTPFQFNEGGELGFELFLEKFVGSIGIHLFATSEQIDGCISIFRPGVNGQMGFCDHHHTTDPMRVEEMEDYIDDRGATSKGCLFHPLSDLVHII